MKVPARATIRASSDPAPTVQAAAGRHGREGANLDGGGRMRQREYVVFLVVATVLLAAGWFAGSGNTVSTQGAPTRELSLHAVRRSLHDHAYHRPARCVPTRRVHRGYLGSRSWFVAVGAGPVERRERVVDGSLQVGDWGRLLVVAAEGAPDRGSDRRRGRGLRGGHPSRRRMPTVKVAVAMTVPTIPRISRVSRLTSSVRARRRCRSTDGCRRVCRARGRRGSPWR